MTKFKVKNSQESLIRPRLFFLITVLVLALIIYLGVIQRNLQLGEQSKTQISPEPTISSLSNTPIPTALPTNTPTPIPKTSSQIPATGEPMICYPAPQEGILHPMFCGTPNMSAPYWCNLQVYPPTYNPFPAFCGYKNQPNSVRQCLFNAVISYNPGGAVGYMSCN